jgi:hypothetical protein
MEPTPVLMTEKYLDGIDWPADKAEVVSAAERNDAPKDFLEGLRAIDREQFDGPNAVHSFLYHEV